MSRPFATEGQSFVASLKSYADTRLVCIAILGCASGFPWVLIGSALAAWAQDAGFSRSAIGLLGGVGTAYAFNFAWAPLVDRLRPLPVLGDRRGWIVLCLIVLAGLTFNLSLTGPATDLYLTGALGLAIGITGATMDTAIDGYRVDIIPRSERALISHGGAAAHAGWWVGYGFPGAAAFLLVDDLGWPGVYRVLAVAPLVLLGLVLIMPDGPRRTRARRNRAASWYRRLRSWLFATFVQPFREFFARNGWQLALAILTFLLVFKMGEAFLGRMSIVFYREVGFSDENIAVASKIFGIVLTIIFALTASLLNGRFGIVRGMFIGGVAMALTNLLFAWVALIGPNMGALLIAIFADNFATSFSTVATIAFISLLTNHVFSATQYALMASISNFGRTTLASASGVLVDKIDGRWPLFFVLTTLMAVPGLLLLWWIAKQPQIQALLLQPTEVEKLEQSHD